MIKFLHSFKPVTALVASVFIFASLAGNAAVTEDNAKQIKPDYPTGSMADWLASPTLWAWNPVNVRLGSHPDRPLGVSYIFPDEATAEAWWPLKTYPTLPMPEGIPDSAVAYIHWVLDNESGEFPGIMAKNDIPGFKSRNCIMASGSEIRLQGEVEEKSCNNPRGASKRFKMVVLKADTPVDLVFNVETAPLTFDNYDSLPVIGVSDTVFNEEAARIYRVLQKWQNGTGTDTVLPDGTPVVNTGVRIVGFSSQLGYGVGGGFTKITDGSKLTSGLGYELRLCLPDHMFDVLRDPKGDPQNDCLDVVDPYTLGELRQELWLEHEYSTFSPKMYSLITDKRTLGVGGYWDKNPAGINPPEIQTESLIDSGKTLDPILGYHGVTTPNYYQIPLKQGVGAVPPILGNVFGYMMPFGVFADGDPDIIASGIYVDDDGDPSTEGDLHSWWDGTSATCCYRYGIDRDYDGAIDAEKFGIVPYEELAKMAARPLSETEILPPPRFEVGYMDDMGSLNVDTFVYLGRAFDVTAHPTFTIRLIAESVTAAGADTDTGNDLPPWVANPPSHDLADLITGVGVVTIDAHTADENVDLTVIDGNIGGADLPIRVTVLNSRSGEIETVTLADDGSNLIFRGVLTTANSSESDANDSGAMNIQSGDVLEARYVDADDGSGNLDVLRTATDTVDAGYVPPSSSDDGGWCSYNPNGRFDPVLPILVLIGLGYLGLRRKFSRK